MSMPKENFGLRILSKMLTYTETQLIYEICLSKYDSLLSLAIPVTNICMYLRFLAIQPIVCFLLLFAVRSIV